MRNDRDNDKDVKVQAVINYLKKHKTEVIYAVVVMDDNCYAGENAHKEISINNRIANEINEQRIFSEEKDDCVHLFLRESEAYDCIEYIKDNLHKDRLELIKDCRDIIKNNKKSQRVFSEVPVQLSMFDII